MDDGRLSEVVSDGVKLRLVGPSIYSACPTDDSGSAYNQIFGNIYEVVACNRFYNRILWGYWPREFGRLAAGALASAPEGWVLDAGCGSLSFTADAYSQYSARPVVLLDSSIKLLRIASTRMTRLCGQVPGNMIFLHADALSMPFRAGVFRTIIAQNLLHAVTDADTMLAELRRILAPEGALSLTTLIESGRFSDAYLGMLSDKGLLVRRGVPDIRALFERAGFSSSIRTRGNMAFISGAKRPG